MTNHNKYIIGFFATVCLITAYYFSVFYGFIDQTSASYECMNAYNLQYQLDEIADTKHNAQMMLLMPELTGMQRASLKVTVRKADKEMKRLEPMFANWFNMCG